MGKIKIRFEDNPNAKTDFGDDPNGFLRQTEEQDEILSPNKMRILNFMTTQMRFQDKMMETLRRKLVLKTMKNEILFFRTTKMTILDFHDNSNEILEQDEEKLREQGMDDNKQQCTEN